MAPTKSGSAEIAANESELADEITPVKALWNLVWFEDLDGDVIACFTLIISQQLSQKVSVVLKSNGALQQQQR